MKKKILLVLLVVVLALTMTAGLVACKKKGTDTPANKADEPTVVTPTVGNEDVSYVLKKTVSGAQTLLGDLAKESDEYGADATIFVKYDDIDAEIRVAANISDDAEALVDVKVGGETIATLYVIDDTLYIGEQIMQPDFSWVKLSQFADEKSVSAFVETLPTYISDAMGTAKSSTGSIFTMANSFIPMIANLGLFTLEVPTGYELDAATIADGSYTLKINMTMIGDLLDTLSATGIDLKATIDSLPAEYAPIVNTALDVVLGGSIDEVLAGTAEFPAISLGLDFKGGNIAGLAINYAKDDMNVSFGIKNLVATAKANVEMAPSINLNKVEEAAIKANVKVDAPAFVVGEDGETLALDLVAYVVPDIKLAFDKDGFYATVDGAKAIAIATNNGEVIATGDYIAANNKFRFDVADLYDYVGYTANKTAFEGYFDLQRFFDGEEDGVTKPLNAEGNPVDSIYDVVLGILDGNFDIGAITGLVDPITAIFDDIIANEIFTVVTDETTASITVDLSSLISYATDSKGIVAKSDLISDALGDKAITDYDSVDAIVGLIAGAAGKEKADIYNLIEKVIGNQNDPAKYLEECTVVFTAVRNADGLGIDVAIKHDATIVVEAFVGLDIVGESKVEASKVPATFSGVNLYEEANYTEFGDDMLTVLKLFFDLIK